MDKSPERVRAMFDSIAPWYDFLNHFLSLGIDLSWRRIAAKNLIDASMPKGPILDICCGTGDMTYALWKQLQRQNRHPIDLDLDAVGRDVILFGIDFSPEMIVRAEKKLPRSEAAFSIGDATEIPFPTGTFAVVSIAFGLRNIVDTQCGLAEMVRVCKPGGKVGILEFSLPKGPLVGRAYRFYFQVLLPLIGRFFSGNRDGAYHYLPESVLEFDSPDQMILRMEAAGLENITVRSMTFGITSLLVGTKREKNIIPP